MDCGSSVQSRRGPVSAKFAQFKRAGIGPLLVNLDHVLAAYQSGPNQITLVMDPRHWQEKGQGFEVFVEGHLDEIWRKLSDPISPPSEPALATGFDVSRTL
jgi:hypothetical protein